MSSMIKSVINFKKSPVITILTDESTDIVVHHKLCINVRVVDPLSLNPSTHFLTDIQLEHANGKEIFEKISGHLKIKGIDMKNVTGLGTDGASVMTGRVEGLTGHFLRANPHIQNNHCFAHRLALCAEQAGDRMPTVVKFRETITALYYYVKCSPTRCAEVSHIQAVLNEPQLKYLEVHQIRWLSFHTAVEAVYRTLDSLLTFFATRTDAKAVGMRKKMGQELFIQWTYAMMDVLPVAVKLSLLFQRKDLDVATVKVLLCEDIKSIEPFCSVKISN